MAKFLGEGATGVSCCGLESEVEQKQAIKGSLPFCGKGAGRSWLAVISFENKRNERIWKAMAFVGDAAGKAGSSGDGEGCRSGSDRNGC